MRRKGAAALVVLGMLSGSRVWAQGVDTGSATLDEALAPGRTVWITDAAGIEQRARIVDFSGGIVTTSTGADTRRWRTVDIVRVRARHSDAVWNGALIGAGVAIASGLLLCTATEPWENCRDDVAPITRIGALGAAIGMGVDALIRGRRTIYERRPGAAEVLAAPLAVPRGGGVVVTLSF